LAGAARRPNLRTDRIGDITPVAKTSDVVPHLLQILKLILPRSSSVAEDSRREITIARNGDSKLDVLASAKRRMLPKRLDVENKAGMPLDGARQPTRQRLDVRVAVAGIDHERLDVTRKTHRPVHLRLNMVIERIVPGLHSVGDQRHSRGDAKACRLLLRRDHNTAYDSQPRCRDHLSPHECPRRLTWGGCGSRVPHNAV